MLSDTSESADSENRAPAARPGGIGLRALVVLLVLLGLVARFRAAAFDAPNLFRSFPSEDGYLMLTVARNLSLGRGLTSAAGTEPTNGVQPLVTLLDAFVFWAVGSSREAGVRALILVYATLAGLTAFAIYRLARRLLEDELGPGASALGAAMWLASPVPLASSMNMLETGPYVLAVVLVALLFTRWHAAAAPWPWRRSASMGALLALAFWTRNDAVLLMAAFGAAHLASAGPVACFARRLKEVSIAGAVAAILSLPWVVFNQLAFGSVVPVSGLLHLGDGAVRQNLAAVAVSLFEMATLVASFQFRPLRYDPRFVALCAVTVVLLIAVASFLVWRVRPARQQVVPWLLPTLFGVALTGFYVFRFEAPHFIGRYLMPLSPFLALLWGLALLRLSAVAIRRGLRGVAVAAAVLLLLSVFVQAGFLVRGPWRRGPLFRGLEWVEANLTEHTWVGAFQSGTLGFFHDRTVNLDGKLNPRALEAVREGRHQSFVAESPVEVIVDWATILEPWYASSAELGARFDWVLIDREENFAVLRRTHRAAAEGRRRASEPASFDIEISRGGALGERGRPGVRAEGDTARR